VCLTRSGYLKSKPHRIATVRFALSSSVSQRPLQAAVLFHQGFELRLYSRQRGRVAAQREAPDGQALAGIAQLQRAYARVVGVLKRQTGQ